MGEATQDMWKDHEGAQLRVNCYQPRLGNPKREQSNQVQKSPWQGASPPALLSDKPAGARNCSKVDWPEQ